jgi:ATP-dependent RNA helicase DeaD
LPDFISLGLSERLVNNLKEHHILTPTPIQQKAIPVVLNGNDVIAQAQTGTGKTFAFILPILDNLDLQSGDIQALIVTPTRELALQITAEIEKMIKNMEDIHVLAVYGGQDVDKQLKKLRKSVQIVVGTPGRLLDHIRRGTIDFSNVTSLVLDEADQMLHIGFFKEVEDIILKTPNTRQTLLFSATMPAEIRKLAQKHMRAPEYIQVEKTQGPAQTVKQLAIYTTDRAKQATLIQLIEAEQPFLAVIFCRTKRRVSNLYVALKTHGFSCEELHGDLSQAKRERVMKRFRDVEFQLLIATDVAARGLDVEGITHVFNYDIPEDSESYVHRIGRTGRAGSSGLAITFYTSKTRSLLDTIEVELNITIMKQNEEKLENEQQAKPDQNNQGSRQKDNRHPRQMKRTKVNGEGEFRDHPRSNDRPRKGNRVNAAQSSRNSESRNKNVNSGKNKRK